MTSNVAKDSVLALLRDKRRALHVGEVVQRLDLQPEDKERVLDALEDLASLGLVTELPGRRFRAKRQPPARSTPPTAPSLNGRLTMHPSGFGFVALEEGGPDVFIPPPAVGGALQGDRVQIRSRPSAKGFEGEVLKVLDRGLTRVTGILRKAAGNAWLDPDDPRMRGPMDVIGKIPASAKPGLHVVADLLRYPRYAEDRPEVEIVDVLGAPGVTQVEVAKLKLRDGVVEEFEPDVLAEARELPTRVTAQDRKGREDLRGIDLCTIDPVDARDHDDAVWGERTEDGGYRVIIAIADVSHYVRPGTALDAAALARGCSIYLPDRAIPMLPPELSSNLASLVAKKDRLCLAVDVRLGPNGGVRSYRFIEGLMRSSAGLTYEGVARALQLTDQADRQREAENRVEGLQVLLDLSRVLRNRRMRRGSLDFDLPEGRIRFDEDGEPVDVYRMKGDPGVRQAYRLIEEMMLLANEVVAQDLAGRSVPTIYRVHGTPDEQKLARFCQLAEALGHPIDPDDAQNPKLLSKFLRKLEGKPASGPLGYLLLRAMQQATYDTTNIGHFGLGSKYYLHFTSPIRRYPDLEVHRVLRKVIQGEEIDGTALRRALKLSAVESSRLERRAMNLERDVMDLYRALLMRGQIGSEFDATLSGVANHGFYSTLDAPFVDVLTPAEALGRDLEVDELGIRLSSRFSGAKWTLSDRVRVRVEEVNIERREVIASPVGEPTGGLGLPETSAADPGRTSSQPRRSRNPQDAPRKRDRFDERRSEKDQRRKKRKDNRREREDRAAKAAPSAKKGRSKWRRR